VYEFELISVESKPSDFKICKKCKRLNWYENEECVNFDCDATEEDFDESHEAVEKWIEDEYAFYMDEEGMTEEQVDHILIEA
jgi:hypothetical protein